MKRESLVKCLAFLLLAVGWIGQATAQPQYYNYNTTGDANMYPFNQPTGMKVQMPFLAGDFSQPSPAPSGSIVKVFFQVHPSWPLGPWDYSQFTINMGQANITSLPAGAYYAGALTTVYSKALVTLSAPAGGWLEIPLDTPFAYDSTQSLIVEVVQCSAPGATGFSSVMTTVSGNRRNWSVGGCMSAFENNWFDVYHFGIALGAALPTPTVATSAATSITTSGATLNGTVNANGSSTTVTFDYGSDTSYGGSVTATQSPVTGTTDTAVSASLTGISPATLLHFRVVGSNAGGTSRGDDMSFTTAGGPPTVTTTAATSITATGARLNGTVNANDVSTDVVFQYGLDTNYGSEVTADQSPVGGTSDVAVSADVAGLDPNTVYHYRAVGTNSADSSLGGDMTFRTAAANGIPTMTEWGIVLLALLLGTVSVLYLGRRRASARGAVS